jgi:hypothetical protein
MSDNGVHIIIITAQSSTGHYITIGGGLSTISDIDFVQVSSVTFLDGYFIVTRYNTGEIWISGLYNVASWDALDYATAEAKPDYAVRVMSTNRELWIFGEETVEPYYNSGNVDFPFQRISGATMPIGTSAPASVVDILGTFYWLSNTLQVMRSSGYSASAISTTSIDYQISTYSVVSDAIGCKCNIEGHMWYVLIFPTEKKTWVYDTSTGVWFEWESYNTADIDVPWSRHRINCCARLGNREYIGDYENGKIYYLDMDTYTDDTHYIQRIRSSQYTHANRANLIYHRLEIEFEAGVGISTGQGSEPKALLDWSYDGGHNWSNSYESLIGKIGEHENRAIWTRLGASRSRVVRLTISDPVKIVILGAYADIEVLTV